MNLYRAFATVGGLTLLSRILGSSATSSSRRYSAPEWWPTHLTWPSAFPTCSAALVSLSANTMGSIALFFLFRAQGILPQLGIALATTLGGWINTFLLWRTLVRRNQFVADRRLKRAVPIIVLASAVMGLTLFLIGQYLVDELLVDQSLLKRATGLTILVVTGFASYVSAVTGVGLMRTSAARQT